MYLHVGHDNHCQATMVYMLSVILYRVIIAFTQNMCRS